MSQDLPGLDPHPSTSTITYQVLSLVYQGLVDFNRDLRIRPVLAESWTTSADGRQWTFKLRKGVKFHNGRPLAAGDVKVSLDRILDPKTAARGRGALAIIESVQVIDPQTVRVHLARRSGAFLSRVAGTFQAIIPPEAVQGPAFKAIGTGPSAARRQAKISASGTSRSGKARGLTTAVPLKRLTSRYPSGPGPRWISTTSAVQSTTQYSAIPASA